MKSNICSHLQLNGVRGSRGGYGRPYRGTQGTWGSDFHSSRGDLWHSGGYGYGEMKRGAISVHPNIRLAILNIWRLIQYWKFIWYEYFILLYFYNAVIKIS